MSDIILPYDPDPFIKTYPYLSFYLGILSGNQIEIQNLLINEFMHIFFFRGRLDFTASGYFERRRFCYQYIRKKDRTVDTFKATITFRFFKQYCANHTSKFSQMKAAHPSTFKVLSIFAACSSTATYILYCLLFYKRKGRKAHIQPIKLTWFKRIPLPPLYTYLKFLNFLDRGKRLSERYFRFR